MRLVTVAKTYGCVGAVWESVNIALLRQGQVLFTSISHNPIAQANISLRYQSLTIFKDSLVHMVGKWKALSSTGRNALDPSIVRFCYQKYADSQLQKEAIELRILGHYSPNVQKA